MNISTFKAEPADIIITGATIPKVGNTDTLRYFDEIKDVWWTSDDFDLWFFYKYCVYYEKGHAKTDCVTDVTTKRGVLPVVHFSYGPGTADSEKLKNGEEFIVDDTVFRIIDENIAVSKAVVGFSIFSQRDERDLCTRFCDSELKKYLDNWLEAIKPKPVFKVTDKRSVSFTDMEVSIGLPTVDDIKNNPHIPARYPYRLMDIRDKTTGCCATGSKISETALSDESIGVCPVLCLPFTPSDLKQGDKIEFQGRLFTVLDNSTKALSLNPFICCPYSTESCDTFGNKEAEYEFYLKSEIHERLTEWFLTANS